MGIEEVNNIYYINKEIEKLQEELRNLKNKNFYKGSVVTGMPRGNSERDIFSDYAEDVRTLENMLQYSLKKLQIERKKVEEFLNTINDAEMRLIIRLRAVNNMRWEDIGTELGMDRRTVSRKFYNFFQNNENCPQCP